MLLALREIIQRSGRTDLEFHGVAYYFCFKKHGSVMEDVREYQRTGKIAPYVAKYVRHLEGFPNGL